MQAEDAGSYAGEYLANAAGTYALTASVNGVPLSTVYTVTIAAGQIRVENSESTLTGWSDGEDVTLWLPFRDCFDTRSYGSCHGGCPVLLFCSRSGRSRLIG